MNEPAGPFAALQYRDFRLLWSGQILSMVGTRMQAAALLWHVYQLTGSEYALGLIGLARVVPLVLFALVGGVVADVLDRRRLMLVCQWIMAVLAAGLGVWSLLGLEVVWPIYLVAGLNAGVTAFENPARQSLIPALVPRDRLTNAVSLNSTSSQLASIVGPAVMGLLIARFSIGLVYCFNAVSYLVVIGALLRMNPPVGDGGQERPKLGLTAAVEGLRFMRRSRLLVSLMLLDFLATFFASANTLLPAYADKVLHADEQTYGYLAAASSAGAAAGAAGMAMAPPIRRQGLLILAAVFAYGVATVAFGFSRTFWASFLALAGTGAADMVSTVLRQTIRQLETPDVLRGRMTAINQVFFQGGPQLGDLEAGIVAGSFGVPVAVISGGVGCMLTVLLTAWRAPWLARYEPAPKEFAPVS